MTAGSSLGMALSVLLAVSCSGAPVLPPLLPASGPADDGASYRCDGDARLADAPAEVSFHEGELWVRGRAGVLVSFDVERGSMRQHFAAERVIDIHRSSHGQIWALTVADGPDDLRVWARQRGDQSGGAWQWLPVLQLGAPEHVLALADVQGRAVVVARGAVYAVNRGGEIWSRNLSEALPEGSAYRMAVTSDGYAYVGVSDAQRGALFRVDLRDGGVATVRLADIGVRCDGSASRSCDPVTSVIVDPRDPGCALVSVAAPPSRGRIARVCGGQLTQAAEVWQASFDHWAARTRELAQLYPEGSDKRRRLLALAGGGAGELPDGAPPPPSAAVLSLARAPEGYLAVTSDALYRVAATDTLRIELPDLQDRCGLRLGVLDGAYILSPGSGHRVGHSAMVASQAVIDVRPTRRPALPVEAPCEGALIYYAYGYTPASDPPDWGYSAVLSCERGLVTMVERGEPAGKSFAVPQQAWTALWGDLERAGWRAWSSCEPGHQGDALRERFVISTAEHNLSVDCPRAKLTEKQRAVMERLRSIADRAAGEGQ